MNKDLEHLRLLSIFHYVLGGITALFGSFPILHIVVGLGMMTGQFGDEQDLHGAGAMFVAFGAVLVLAAWAFAILIVVAGRLIGRRRAYVFCLVVAGFECMYFPFGTALGVCVFVVLLRPEVKGLFYADSSPSGVSHA